MIGDQTQHPVDGGPRPVGIPFRSGHQADEDSLVVDDEGGNPEYVEAGYDIFVLDPDLLGRPALIDLGQDRLTVHAGPVQCPEDHGPIPQIAPVFVSGGEERPVYRGEVLREPVPGHDAGSQGDEVGLLVRVLPGRNATLGNMGLIEEERYEGHFPRRTGGQGIEDVLMADAGERAPIVPGHGEALR